MAPCELIFLGAEFERVRSLSQFLKQYFNLYDGDNREQLMEAYHEDAVMSMSIAYPTNVSAHGSQR